MLDAEIAQIIFWPTALLVFLWGLVWGSFFNVCIYRIPVGKSVSFPGSHCYTCGSPVRWYDNIPLISYLILGGNCRFCGTHFSPRYFFVELLTGLLFLAAYLSFGLQLQTPFHMIFIGLLIIGTFTDIDHFIIPDRITLGGLAFAIVATGLLANHSFIAQEYRTATAIWHQLSFNWSAKRLPARLPIYLPLLYSLASAAFGYAMLWALGWFGKLLFRKEAMGMGDVKLFAFLGAWMGITSCIWILFLSALVGAVMGLSLLLAHKMVGKDEYETLVLPGQPTVKSQWLTAVPPLVNANLPSPGTEAEVAQDAANPHTSGEEDLVQLEFSRKTSRQLHHFPYGPYIAIAAVIILLFHKQVDQVVRSFFFLE
jgi:leader peptidase (prepilin peptidase)/N-methyltransferase